MTYAHQVDANQGEIVAALDVDVATIKRRLGKYMPPEATEPVVEQAEEPQPELESDAPMDGTMNEMAARWEAAHA